MCKLHDSVYYALFNACCCMHVIVIKVYYKVLYIRDSLRVPSCYSRSGSNSCSYVYYNCYTIPEGKGKLIILYPVLQETCSSGRPRSDTSCKSGQDSCKILQACGPHFSCMFAKLWVLQESCKRIQKYLARNL